MDTILEVKGLSVKYHTREGTLTALRDVDFTVKKGEIVGVVGESGCGKSTLASSIIRLLPPNGEITGGQILFYDQDLRQLEQDEIRQIRGKDMSMIFQDPMTSLNPVFTIEQQMVDALMAHRTSNENHSNGRGHRAGIRGVQSPLMLTSVAPTPQDQAALRARAVAMLDRVGIPDAGRQIKEYPHQFSGGMRQRIMIAIALLSQPALLIADEPTSALDVTLEAQIVELIRGLRDELGTSILYITHDLGVVAQLCDQVLVMYAGNIVESGDVYGIFENPKHPYTQALLSSHPTHSMHAIRLRTIGGRVPSLLELPEGCKFAPRCDFAADVCHSTEPKHARADGQLVLCHAYHPSWPGEEPSVMEAAPQERLFSKGRDFRHNDLNGTEQRRQTIAGQEDAEGNVILEVQDIRTHFRDHVAILSQILGRRGTTVRAIDGVTIQVRRGETIALVGESGSGKTTLGRTILRLQRSIAGRIIVDGKNMTDLSQREIQPMRARMQMIFQDPCSSLSPRMKVSSLLMEPFRIHGVEVNIGTKVDELLAMVGLSTEQGEKYAHQLSGGQARRVGIARALALLPDILVADEPTSGLDVSVAAGILNLLKDLRDEFNLTYIIITHNLNVVSFIADRVAVMYLGKIVELAHTRELFAHPKHPYTEALMSAIPVPDPRLRANRQRILLQGEIPSPRNPPSGCHFHPRCRYCQERCTTDIPSLNPVSLASLTMENGSEHLTACHFPEHVQGGLFLP